MVGVRQIIVDGLGYPNHAKLVASLNGLLMNFVGSVLRVISASIEEKPDIVSLKHLKQTIHVFGCMFRVICKVNLVTAGT